MKKATTIDEQISRLRERGMLIANDEHARKVLLSVGYYRLGFYWFPFEVSQDLNKRNHRFVENTTWEKAEALYNFDDNLRNLLAFYLQTIETDMRTFLTYTVSNYYADDPFWFSKRKCVSIDFIERLKNEIYPTIRNNDAIIRHHRRHNHVYAPAWKTIEFFMFGDLVRLYESLQEPALQTEIRAHYNIRNPKVFRSYIDTLRKVRNVCAHSHILYDIRLSKSIKKGVIEMQGGEAGNIVGVLKLVYYMLGQINPAKKSEMYSRIADLVQQPEFGLVHDIIARVAFNPFENHSASHRTTCSASSTLCDRTRNGH